MRRRLPLSRTTEAQRHRGRVVKTLWLCVSVVCFVWLSLALSAQQLLDRVVARVNGQPITLSDVIAAVALGLVPAPSTPNVVPAVTAQLVDRQLMLAEVARFAPPEPDAAAIGREVEALKSRAGARLAAVMDEAGLDEQRIHDLARDTLRIQGYLNQRFGATVQVTDDEVERYYREHPAEFTRAGVLIPFEEAAPTARQRAAAQRRDALIGQWLRDLRARADVTTRP